MRPCLCDRPNECRLCWLYRHDARYRALWDETPTPTAPRVAACLFLGDVLDRRACPCPARWLRLCEIHRVCTLEQCKTCPDYQEA